MALTEYLSSHWVGDNEPMFRWLKVLKTGNFKIKGRDKDLPAVSTHVGRRMVERPDAPSLFLEPNAPEMVLIYLCGWTSHTIAPLKDSTSH